MKAELVNWTNPDNSQETRVTLDHSSLSISIQKARDLLDDLSGLLQEYDIDEFNARKNNGQKTFYFHPSIKKGVDVEGEAV